MNTLLADRPAGAEPAPPSASEPPEKAPEQDAVPRRACKGCGATLAPGQEWCLQCGAGEPGSVGEAPAWRALAAIAAATAILLAGAGAAAYAALSRPTHKSPPHVAVATVPAPSTSVPSTTTPLPTTPLPVTPTPSTPAATLPPVTTKPPSIPATTPTPSTGAPNTGAGTGGSTTATPTNTNGTTTPPAPATPKPILLDTDAASTYNPYAYPADSFGDPSLTIDGEQATAWTAAVQPASAPRMAEGLLIDLRTAHRLGSLEVDSAPIGTTVEVFAANGHSVPATITDPAWKKLNGGHVLKKKTATLKLHAGSATYRFVVLWLTKAPAGASRIGVSELSLFPPVK